MFKFLRKEEPQPQAADPLWYRLALELKNCEGPMPRRDLVTLFEGEFGREHVESVIDMMIATNLLAERELFFTEGWWGHKEQGLELPPHWRWDQAA